jgi:hypothetical protein
VAEVRFGFHEVVSERGWDDSLEQKTRQSWLMQTFSADTDHKGASLSDFGLSKRGPLKGRFWDNNESVLGQQ